MTAALHDLQRIVGQANAFVPDDHSSYLVDATELRGTVISPTDDEKRMLVAVTSSTRPTNAVPSRRTSCAMCPSSVGFRFAVEMVSCA